MARNRDIAAQADRVRAAVLDPKKRAREIARLNRMVGQRSSARERVDAAATAPEWNRHCAEFAATHVKATTGRDLWEEVGGCPRSAREAADLLRRLKVRSYKDAVSRLLGRPVSSKHAMRGDLVMVDNALGICRGDLVECMDRMQPIARAECAWRVSSGGRSRPASARPRHRDNRT